MFPILLAEPQYRRTDAARFPTTRRSFFQYCVNSRAIADMPLTEEHLYRDQCVMPSESAVALKRGKETAGTLF